MNVKKTKGSKKIVLKISMSMTVMIYSKIEELHVDCERCWGRIAPPLKQVIQANNLTTLGLKERDIQLTCREDIMDAHITADRVKIERLESTVGVVSYLMV